jgi:hypothetical protein
MAQKLVLARMENGLTARVGEGFAKTHNLELVDEPDAAPAAPRKRAAKKTAAKKTAKKSAAKTSPAKAEDSTTTASQGSAPSTEEENR